ncbi:MAG: class I SAM-dependent rRNA methyltransferase [Deltaproteobacteria bacterium HGW-Deltaproteobacteria-22]|nr:MAG: class I SAM-dependent rRNA methyltransferase [Deltaproteobacteria bacterium HGW-Deltaproteobacteria-22]
MTAPTIWSASSARSTPWSRNGKRSSPWWNNPRMAHDVSDSLISIRIASRGVARLRNGLPWVWADDVQAPSPSLPAGVVGLRSPRGEWLGQGFYNPASTIRVRFLAATTRPLDEKWLLRQLSEAAQLRNGPLGLAEASCRLVHSESDHLPGVVLDRIGDALVLQTLCAGADTWIERLQAAATELFNPRLFVLKNTARSRAAEKLVQETRVLSGTPGPTVYREGELEFETDLLGDQKTGAFLDQRDNHLMMGKIARGTALDLFCYHGGFALAMARNGATVTAVDASQAAIDRLHGNARRNGLSATGVCADAFDYLKNDDTRWDTIVCDPPALSPHARDKKNALNAYRQLAAGCFSRLRAGGMLLFCSCSAHVLPEDLLGALVAGARDCGGKDAPGRTFCVHRFVQAGPDHPSHPLIPESAYLKGFLVRAT